MSRGTAAEGSRADREAAPGGSHNLAWSWPLYVGRLVAAVAGVNLLMCAALETSAEWTIQPESSFFYTDDASLFSATRRTLKDQDPTQPILDFDLAEKGSAFVYEPGLDISKTLTLLGEETTFHLRGQGFLFPGKSRFDHGSMAFEVRRNVGTQFEAIARYYFLPKLFLGRNEVREPESPGAGPEPEEFQSERLDTHFWAVGLRYQLSERAAATAFGRVGIRRYERPFEHRDTDFFTAGVHAEFELNEHIELGLAMHYERGLADGRNGNERALRDDISYHNYFLSGEAAFHLFPRTELELALHYEHNDFSTGIERDERKGEAENSVQGDVLLVYELTDALDLTAGFQGVYRKETFEDSLGNLNAWLGVQASF